MDELKCPKCNHPKTEDDFGKRKSGGEHRRNRWCKVCCSEAVKKVYRESLEYRQQHKNAQKRRGLENHRRIFEYLLAHSCVGCGEADPLVLQFDHEQGKTTCVTGMSLYSWERILVEIQKCVVRCANCHARKTAEEANTVRYQLVQEVNSGSLVGALYAQRATLQPLTRDRPVQVRRSCNGTGDEQPA